MGTALSLVYLVAIAIFMGIVLVVEGKERKADPDASRRRPRR